MTDLERLWEELPTSSPPVDAVLRRGRATTAVRRRRHLTRPLTAGVVLAALGGAFLTGTLVSDPGSPTGVGAHQGTAAAGGPRLAAFQADLSAADSCQQLLTAYIHRGLGDVSAYGWSFGLLGPGLTGDLAAQSDSVASVRTATPGLPASQRQVASATGTNVQETGVDEPDTVKTDGSTLVRLRDQELQVYDVSGHRVRERSMLTLSDLGRGELLLAGDRVVALGADTTSPRDDETGQRRGTRVITISLADPDKPVVTSNVTYASRLLSARQHGDTVRLVLSAGLPDLSFVRPGKHRTQKQALTHNRRVVRRTTIEDWLPSYDAGHGSRSLLDCRNVAIPPAKLGLDTVSVVGFDAASPTTPEAIGLAGRTDVAYESSDDLYLAATPATGLLLDCGLCAGRFIGGGTTYLFDFALDGVHATHVASGEVEGTVADRWAMDSVGGTLRVAVGQSSETGPFNSIVTFRRQGTHLVEAGRLDHLGQGEDIRSVRWFHDLAILVTYRQMDPVYAVDLSRPARPRLLGKLRIPGFSSYLHPLGPDRILGLGQARVGGSGPDGRWAAQAALFDVSDLGHLRRLTVHHYGPGTTPVAGEDPRAFTWLPDGRHVLTVIQRGRTGYLSVMWVHAHRLHERHLRVEYGTDIAAVRTIGLPDGRVVLITGEKVRFLDV